LPELNLGIIPGAVGRQRLSRTVGERRALVMCLTINIVDGEEAQRIVLVTYLTQTDAEDHNINEDTQNISKKCTIALSLAKKTAHIGYEIDEDAAQWIEKLSQAVVFGTEDKQEGTLAFLEKRQANFKNK